MQLLADRFLQREGRWFDMATARQVVVSVHAAGPLRVQIAWAERCAMHAALRHPLLNPLVDYGVAGPRALFEAFALEHPGGRAPRAPARPARHVSRFLEGHGVFLPAELARVAIRRAPARAPAGTRPVGVVLQARAADALVAELFTTARRGGVTEIRLSGARGSGLRTLLAAAARYARAAGYVPICPAALVCWPGLVAAVSGRHVCVVTHAAASAPERLALGTFLIRLAAASTRPHLCLIAERATERLPGVAVHLEAMGAAQMSSMVYLDPEVGPSAEAVLDAARHARGNPGRFVSALACGEYGDESSTMPLTVHETPPPYAPTEPAAPTADRLCRRRSRLDATIWRARPRAAALQRKGRHAAASRLLARAAGVLEGKGERREAGQCWLELAWMRRSRGATSEAAGMAARARTADPSAETQLGAACVDAVCWTDELRLPEAEAALRSLAVAASSLGAGPDHQKCMLALARVLYWQGRYHEVLSTLEPLQAIDSAEAACEALSRSARAHLQLGEVPRAVRMAREGLRRATECHELRVYARSQATVGEALLAAGDAEAACGMISAGLRSAAVARLPLLSLRIRALLWRALTDAGAREDHRRRLRIGIDRARRRPLPLLVGQALETGLEGVRETRDAGAAAADGMARVGHFLDIAQRAQDDQTAIADVLTALCETTAAVSAGVVARDGRVIATAGRPFREAPRAAMQAIACGKAVEAGRDAHGDAAEPVRCGGEVLGAIECRWAPGTQIVSRVVAAALCAAGMAMATHLRSVLETAASAPPASAWGDLLGESRAAVVLREGIARASRAPFPVLIEGESGSGKELVARAIHRLSPRHVRRFCAINCAALSDELVEAELFGHTRGAFTGATTERAGLFEEADGGTLFLDEVGELSARAQAKLLRVLQEGEVRRVGENLPRRVDVRVVAATNRRLEQETAGGRFRMDLRFRLDVLRITVPPLRERVEDIPVLAHCFWAQACARLGSKATLGADAVAALSRYDWPGNVRELQNAIAWIAVHAPRRGRIGAAALPAQLATSPLATGTFEAAREEFERRYVRAALAQAGGQRQMAARALGISRQGLAKMLRRLGIEPGEVA